MPACHQMSDYLQSDLWDEVCVKVGHEVAWEQITVSRAREVHLMGLYEVGVCVRVRACVGACVCARPPHGND